MIPIVVGSTVRFKPRPHREWDQYSGQTGEVLDHTTDDMFRVRWDEPNRHPEFFNLERVFAREDLRPTLDNDEVDIINELVEPFIAAQHADNRPCSGGGIDRGIMLTMLDKNNKLRRIKVEILQKKEEDPD